MKQANRAFWWQYPSLSDPPVGPWSADLPRADDEPLHHWQRAIDWMADLGINVFIANADSYVKGAKHSQCPDWPFALVCAWPDHPHAQTYSTWRLNQRRREFRQILAHFQRRQIRVLLHHYNFFAPHQWLIRQPELARKRLILGDVTELSESSPAALARSVCANDPAFRQFMQDSWRELFQHLPELDGLLISLGESNRCQCPECCGRQPGQPEGPYEIASQRISTFARFANLFVDTLREQNKTPMIRAWHGGGDEQIARAMPKGITYVIKYSGFNSIDSGPDPIYRYWRDAGHRLWVVHEVAGNENAGACTWINPKWVYDVNQRALAEMPIDGSVAFHNNFMARLDQVYPPVFFNMQAAAHAFSDPRYDDSEWIKRATASLGPLGPTYLKASRLYSQVILNIDKIVSSPTDGICFCFHNKLLGDGWPGVVGELGAHGTEPHPWIRGNVAPLRRYRQFLEDHPWSDDIAKRAIPAGETDPVRFCADLWKRAQEGLSLIDPEPVDLPPEHASGHRILYLSGRWAVEFGRFWHNMIRAKVLWWGANSLRTKMAVHQELARECLGCIDEMIDAVVELQSVLYEYPSQYVLWGRLDASCSMEQKLALCRKTRSEVAAHFRPLLNGEVFRWPTAAHFDWPDK